METAKSTEDAYRSLDRYASTPDVNLSRLIDSGKLSRFQIVVITLCGFLMLIDGFDMQIIGYIAPLVAKEWGVPRSALGPVFSLGLTGLMVGFLIFSPLSDKLGHRRILIGCTLVFSIFTFLTLTATDVTHLALFRFLTGIGLGGVTPSAVALTSEYSPKRIRATAVLIIYCGFSLGFVIAGVVAAQLVPLYGWHSLLWVGGSMPLLLGIILIFILPESLNFMVTTRFELEAILKVVRRLAPDLRLSNRATFTVDTGKPASIPLFVIFERHRAAGTLLIWTAFFMNLGVFYALQSWLPTVLTNGGYSIGNVATVTALTTTGGIVAVLFVGPLMDRSNPYMTVAGLFLGGCVLVACLGVALTWSLPVLMLLAFSTGFCVSGGQKSGIALSALFYPLPIRSTGVGWALGMSRLGGIFGPLVFGWLLDQGWPPATVFLACGAPMLIAGIAVFTMGRLYHLEAHTNPSTHDIPAETLLVELPKED